MKYVSNPVWKAPEATQRATWTAFFWRRTILEVRDMHTNSNRDVSPVFPELIVLSKAVTRSLNTVSTLSSPARTSIMSELGFVYFLEKTLVKNTVKF